MLIYTCISESVAWYLIRDPENDGKKCGDSPDSSNRSFKLTGSTATTRNCYSFCKHDKDCVAFSGVYEKWCIGCKVALSSPHEGAEAFKRTVPGKADGNYVSIYFYTRKYNNKFLFN